MLSCTSGIEFLDLSSVFHPTYCFCMVTHGYSKAVRSKLEIGQLEHNYVSITAIKQNSLTKFGFLFSFVSVCSMAATSDLFIFCATMLDLSLMKESQELHSSILFPNHFLLWFSTYCCPLFPLTALPVHSPDFFPVTLFNPLYKMSLPVW